MRYHEYPMCLLPEVTVAACAHCGVAVTACPDAGQIKTHTWFIALIHCTQNVLCNSVGAATFIKLHGKRVQI